MEQREYGRSGERLSVIGFGGIVVRDLSPTAAAACVGEAIDRGINYFDIAPSYGDAQERLGPALEPWRDRVFLACKTTQREAEGAGRELRESLRMLRTDHFDLYQLHGVSKAEDVDRILAPGGALEAFVKARDEGLVRHLGFSAHSEAAALRLLDAFPFASVLFPCNRCCWQQGNLGPALCRRARATGTALLGLKALARRRWREGEERRWNKCWYQPIDNLPEARIAIAFALSRGLVATVPPGHAELLRLACDAVESLEREPIAAPEQEPLAGEPIFSTDLGATGEPHP